MNDPDLCGEVQRDPSIIPALETYLNATALNFGVKINPDGTAGFNDETVSARSTLPSRKIWCIWAIADYILWYARNNHSPEGYSVQHHKGCTAMQR